MASSVSSRSRAKPSARIEPRSPPEPFTQSTPIGAPVIGSAAASFAEVLPPPKLVTARSAPSRLER